jgi:phosphatidylserine/phosphatidylglycerophosphate/cardiolipin synthase-like enzyme
VTLLRQAAYICTRPSHLHVPTLLEARESIYILDWWLSPELYLRRPPSRNEQYRLDNMLRAAAERGVSINIIVYKEVPQALTREYRQPLTRPGTSVSY